LSFIRGKNYDYVTESNNKLAELTGIARSERYYQEAEEEFEALKKKLAHDKEKDLQTFKEEIKSLIMEEIAGRYYYQKGKIRASLNQDKSLEKAIEICEDNELYNKLLSDRKNNFGSFICRIKDSLFFFIFALCSVSSYTHLLNNRYIVFNVGIIMSFNTACQRMFCIIGSSIHGCYRNTLGEVPV